MSLKEGQRSFNCAVADDLLSVLGPLRAGACLAASNCATVKGQITSSVRSAMKS